MSDKEKIVANLMASGNSGADGIGAGESGKKKVLIEEVGGSSNGSSVSDSSSLSGTTTASGVQQQQQQQQHAPKVVPVVPDEGPSLMEQMMAAQQQAKKKDDVVKAKLKAKEDKKALGGGFKKGFFGGGSATKKPTKASSSSAKPPASTEHIPTITAKKAPKKTGGGVVLDDVQRALKEEEERNPLMQQLKGGEWATDDLMGKLQSNPVLLRGLQNPKCQEAMQLMQSDPTAAKKKFEHDAEVGAFMQAFSAVMAEHFTRLGEQQAKEEAQKNPPPVPIPEGNVEVGPLHAQAMAREKERQGKAGGAITEVNREEEARVKEIVQDDELRDLLMDPKLQQILQECNDPRKFQAHMRDPVTAYKIKKLYDAGLVGTAK